MANLSAKPSGSVFISYARGTSREPAEAVHNALGGDHSLAFLDSSAIEPGDTIPNKVFQGLLNARVIVVFADANYFTRRYCVEELMTAVRAYSVLAARGADARDLENALPVVVALPASGAKPEELERLPPPISARNWPSATQTELLLELVHSQLTAVGITIGKRLQDLGELDGLRERLHETMSIPSPRTLQGARLYNEMGLTRSIGNAFVGRARELWELHSVLSTRQVGTSAAALTGALEGAGGFGKTRLAVEYLYRYGPPNYPGGLFWVNADVSDDRVEAQLHGILKTLKPGTPDLIIFRQSGRKASGELGQALHELKAQERVLYVVDNVPEAAPGQRPQGLEKWCPAIGKVALLVTSRARQSLQADVHRIEIREVSTEAAVMLLTRNTARVSLPEGSWKRITEWVGNWPLALELLNAALRSGSLNPGDLLKRAQELGPAPELDRQMEALRGAVPEGTLRGVTEALGISYRQLAPQAQRATRLLALLSPEPIPLAIVNALGDQSMPAGAKVAVVSRSFVSDVSGTAVEMFGRMHRVLADFLRGKIEDEQELDEVYQSILEVMELEACHDPAQWPLMDACRPHAEFMFSRPPASSSSTESKRLAVRLGRPIVNLLVARGRLEDAHVIASFNVELAKRLLNSEDPITLTAMADQGSLLYASGARNDAKLLLEQVMEARQRLLGEGHPDTLTTANDLALTIRELGDVNGARRLQEHVLEVSSRLLGEEHPDSFRAMGNLAETLRTQGELREAHRLQERVLNDSRRRLGDEHPKTLAAMHNMAATLAKEGDLAGARHLQEQVLQKSRFLLGEDHPNTLIAMFNLALTLSALGDEDGARTLRTKARELLGLESSAP